MAFALAPHAAAMLFGERFKQRESDIDRLIIFRFGAGDVAGQRAHRARRRRSDRALPGDELRRIEPRQPARRDRFHVTFDAADLTGEKDLRALAHLHRGREHARATDISIRSEEHTSELQSPYV